MQTAVAGARSIVMKRRETGCILSYDARGLNQRGIDYLCRSESR
jgi:hypothetical protein